MSLIRRFQKTNDPNTLRKDFYSRYWRNFDTCDNLLPILQDKFSDEKILFDNAFIFSCEKGGYTTFDCGSCGSEWDTFMIVWQDEKIFYSVEVDANQSTYCGINEELDYKDMNWTLNNIQIANFIDITIEYNQTIRVICEKYGYKDVINHIKINH